MYPIYIICVTCSQLSELKFWVKSRKLLKTNNDQNLVKVLVHKVQSDSTMWGASSFSSRLFSCVQPYLNLFRSSTCDTLTTVCTSFHAAFVAHLKHYPSFKNFNWKVTAPGSYLHAIYSQLCKCRIHDQALGNGLNS